MDTLELKRALAKLLVSGDLEAAIKLAEPLRDPADRERTRVWLDLMRHAPFHADAGTAACEAVERFPDPEVVVAACATLIARAERRGFDEPPILSENDATRAAHAATQCIADHPGHALTAYLEINLANALRLCGPDRDAEASAAYASALAREPDRGWWWFDLGTLHKWRGRFQDCADATARANALLGDKRPVLFNLAIAQTALGLGEAAAATWKTLSIPATVGEHGMPRVDGIPPLSVRVLSRESGYGAHRALPDGAVSFELLQVEALSPCHGVVTTPSFGDCPVDLGDVLLFDANPVARAQDGAPRFAVLEILRKSAQPTHRFVALDTHDGAALEEVFGDHAFVAAPVVEEVRERAPDGEGRASARALPSQTNGLFYGKVAGLSLAEVHAGYHALAERKVRIAIPTLFEASGDTKRAGTEHQAWRTIEQLALKRAERTQ